MTNHGTQWSYRIFPEHALIYVRLEGRLSMTAVMAARGTANSDPNFNPRYRSILDLRGCYAGGLSLADAAMLASISMFHAEASRAVVADDPAVRERASAAGGLAVFSTLEEALAALNLENLREALAATMRWTGGPDAR